MRIERLFGGPNRWTFTIKPIKQLLQEEMNDGLWIDPFAGMYSPARITNDLNPEAKAQYHIDALQFLSRFEYEEIDGVLFDPPYSVRQVSECYKKHGYEVTQETTQASWYSRIRNQIADIIKPNGKVISFGWNSNGIGKTRGFELKRVLLVAHGGIHHDTIVTVERKLV